MKFNAVAFDLDGTLYPNYRFYYRLLPFLFKDRRLLMAMGKARNKLRKNEDLYGDCGEGFYKSQAEIMGGILGESTEYVREKTERLIYRGWEPLFKKVKLFSYVKETLDAFRKAGIKLGLLSDFPPETKLLNLEISDYWHVVVCSEMTGRLKPDKVPFLELASRMGMSPEDVLYVGNSFPYDVEGAQKAGMKAALIRPGWKNFLSLAFYGSKRKGNASRDATSGAYRNQPDFCFSAYRQLCDYVLY